MSKYAVNEEGVQALSTMASSSLEAVSQITSLTARMSSVAENNSSTLGPHKQSLDTAIEDIISSLQSANEPIETLAEKLREVAEAYNEIIGNDRMKPGSNAPSTASGSNGGQSKTGSFLGRIFGGKKETTSSQKFGSFDLGKYRNGAFVIKGDNFEQYISDYYNPVSNIPCEPYIETVPPSKIEGISNFGIDEVEDNSIFWRQHDSHGTFESFKEIASHIPEVKSQLDAGKALSEIRSNPDLEKCVSIFFDPSNIPHVIKNDGYYEFDSNGRHRILAARELGYDIPVRIIGIRTHK